MGIEPMTFGNRRTENRCGKPLRYVPQHIVFLMTIKTLKQVIAQGLSIDTAGAYYPPCLLSNGVDIALMLNGVEESHSGT